MDDLQARLLSAHAAADGRALVTLFTEAADKAQSLDAECFFLTQAYVYALETAHSETARLHARLKTKGREE